MRLGRFGLLCMDAIRKIKDSSVSWGGGFTQRSRGFGGFSRRSATGDLVFIQQSLSELDEVRALGSLGGLDGLSSFEAGALPVGRA